MTEHSSTLATIYEGWNNYQALMVQALTPLSEEQLALSAAPGLRTVDEIVRHIIGARGRWLGEDGQEMAELGTWDRQGMPPRTAAELVRGLETTWRLMHEAIASWTPEAWAMTFPGEPPEEPAVITRQWVIWHLIEHDLHHGGEVALTLGAHGLQALHL